MAWGSWGSWGHNAFGPSSSSRSWGTWGHSGFGTTKSHGSGHRFPNGQHHNTCSAPFSGFGSRHGFFGHHYEEHCHGCRRSRSFTPWGGHQHGGDALKMVSLFHGGTKLAKKSLWG